MEPPSLGERGEEEGLPPVMPGPPPSPLPLRRSLACASSVVDGSSGGSEVKLDEAREELRETTDA